MSLSARLAGMIVTVAALAAASSAFGGAEVQFSAKVREASGSDRMQYYGRVKSDVEECQAGRTVRITSSGRLIGRTRTEESGKYSIVAKRVPNGSSVKFKLKRNGTECPASTLFVEL